MDSIAFKSSKKKKGGVQIFINGRDLVDLIREVELPFATGEGHPEIAGAYSGLSAEMVFLPSLHFLGEPEPIYADDEGRTFILECECGEPGCWPFAVRITLQEHEVIWSDFCQPHRTSESKTGEWCYDTLPSFVFDRKSYEQTLR